jgi:hypothetical protein
MEVFGQTTSGKSGFILSVSNPVESSMNADFVLEQKAKHSFNCRPEPACKRMDFSPEFWGTASHLVISQDSNAKSELKRAFANFPEPTTTIFILPF